MSHSPSSTGSEATVRVATRPVGSHWLWTTGTLALSAVILLAFFSWSKSRFGSVNTALTRLSGKSLLIDSSVKSIGSVESGPSELVTFQLINIGNRPVTLIGYASRCSCTAVTDFPKVVAPGRRISLNVMVSTKALSGPFDEPLQVFTDDLTNGAINLRVVGHVKNPKKAAPSRSPSKETGSK